MNDHFEPVVRFWERDRLELERLRGNFIVACVVAGVGWTVVLILFCMSL
jgi:hypothetical protein